MAVPPSMFHVATHDEIAVLRQGAELGHVAHAGGHRKVGQEGPQAESAHAAQDDGHGLCHALRGVDAARPDGSRGLRALTEIDRHISQLRGSTTSSGAGGAAAAAAAAA